MLAGGYGNYQPPQVFEGFMSPLVSRTSCVGSVARSYEVRPDSVKLLGARASMS